MWGKNMLWASVLIGSFIVTILAHSLLCYVINTGTALIKFLAVGFLIGGLMLFKLYGMYNISIQMVSAGLAYALLCELYIFMFTFVASSISVSILLRLNNSQVNLELLAANYTGKSMVANRIKRLQEVDLLELHGSILLTTLRGNKLLQKFNRLQTFFKLSAV